MNTNNVSNTSPSQLAFSNLAEINKDPSCLSSTSACQSPPPPMIVQPTSLPNPQFPSQPKAVPRPQPRSNIPVDPNGIPPETADIMDYMDWSIVNVVLGAFVIGIFCVVLSKVTDKHKKAGDVRLAHIYSRLTLALNIFITLSFMCAVIGLITYYKGVY